MGLLSWLFGPREHHFLDHKHDCIWMSRAELYRGLLETCQNRPDGTLTLVVVHFPGTATEFRAIADGRLSFVEATDNSDWSNAVTPTPQNPSPIVLLQSAAIPRLGSPAWPGALGELRIIPIERHFLRERDDAIAAFGERFTRPGRLQFQISLDDALIRLFMKANVLEFLRSGGSASLESRMVGNSLKKAQARVEKRAVSKLDTATADEWIETNLR